MRFIVVDLIIEIVMLDESALGRWMNYRNIYFFLNCILIMLTYLLINV